MLGTYFVNVSDVLMAKYVARLNYFCFLFSVFCPVDGHRRIS